MQTHLLTPARGPVADDPHQGVQAALLHSEGTPAVTLVDNTLNTVLTIIV